MTKDVSSSPAFKLPSKHQLDAALQVSKWLTCPLLLDAEEMKDLLNSLPPFYFIQTSGVIKPGNEWIATDEFLEIYTQYVTALKNGELLKEQIFRPYFSCVMTTHLDALYTVAINDSQELVKACRPIIQLQVHRFDYSKVDKKFRSMVLGAQSVLWGVVFSYPQLYQDSNFQVYPIRDQADFPNTFLFKQIQQWMRQFTIPTPIEAEGKLTHVPIRLGKKCLEWINNHPQLQAKGLKVIANKLDKSVHHPHC